MKDKITIPGILLTILATIFFAWSIYQWVYITDYPREMTDDDILDNEIEAYRNLKQIIDAQNEFYDKDLNDNNVKDYSNFVPHLYLLAHKERKSATLKLISEEVAFSKSSQNGCNGYIYTGLQRIRIKLDEYETINCQEKWAAVAYPKNLDVTGRFTFITDHTNKIFAKKGLKKLEYYPYSPEKKGWVKISSEEQIIQEVKD